MIGDGGTKNHCPGIKPCQEILGVDTKKKFSRLNDTSLNTK